MSFRKWVGIPLLISSIGLSGCGTMTGIPSHGGGKRFATEQKLVSASIRNTLRAIDVSPLRGHKVALIFDLISDTGGGNLSGGRFNLAGVLKAASVISPVTSTASQFQVFDLINSNSNFQNVNTGSNGASTAGTTNIVTSNGTSNTNGTNSSGTTSNGTVNYPQTTTTVNNSGSTTTINNPAVTTTTNNPQTTTTTTTGPTTTTQVTNANSGSTITGANTGTSVTGASSTTSVTNPYTQTSSNTSNTNGTNSSNTTSNSTSNGTTNSVGTSTNTTNSASNGGYTLNHQQISPGAVSSQVQKRGKDLNAGVNLVYKGLGNYSNLAVPKSDASLLMGLVRNYLMIKGVRVTVPTDPEATAIVYVTVDVFGIVRSRFDMYAYNKETVRAETAIEMMAFDKRGKMIMRPRSANEEAEYNERYILWAGPFITDKSTRKGEGLLVDFSDLKKYGRSKPVDVRTERNVIQVP